MQGAVTDTKTVVSITEIAARGSPSLKALSERGVAPVHKATLTAFETEDYLLFAGVTDGGDELDSAQCRRLFDIPAQEGAAGGLHSGHSPAL